MKRIISALLITFFLAGAGLLWAWTGTNQNCEIISPDGFNDNSSLNLPIKVIFKGKNTSNGVDYYKFYLVTETGTDTVISDTEWSARVFLWQIEDINQDTTFVVGWLDQTKVDTGHFYYLVGVGKDISGNTSCDTTKIGGDNMNGVGDAGATDSAIARFYVGGYKP